MAQRIFVVDGKEYPDPDPSQTVEQVQQSFADFFPELATAQVKTTQRGDDMVYEFQRRVGTKGRRRGV